MNIFSKVKEWNWEILAVLGLSTLIWAGYNTGIERVADPAFPHGILDLIHGLRAFLPILAGVFSVAFLIRGKQKLPRYFFLTPLALLLLYALVGVISSVFSTHVVFALYWAVVYGVVAVVLLLFVQKEKGLEYLAWVIKLNWIIAGAIAFALLVFFLIQPGTISSLTLNFLICVKRPYENLGAIGAGVVEFGMAASRPTGFGRYAGIAALVAFVTFLNISEKKKKLLPFLVFILFAGILFFSKGKTEIVAFMVAMASTIFLSKKYALHVIGIFVVMALMTYVVIFLVLPCVAPEPSVIFSDAPQSVAPESTVQFRDIKIITTLSGRTGGVWNDTWNLFLSAPILGRGFQADRYFLDGQHAHNTILQALIQTGTMGTVLFVVAIGWFLYMLWKLLRNPAIQGNQKVFLIEVTTVAIFLLVRGLTESLAFFSADWIFMAPLIAYIQVLYYSAPNQIT